MENSVQPARIWIIGAEQWPRAFLRAELLERGHDAVGFLTIRDALIQRKVAPSERPDLIVCDLHGQDPGPDLTALFAGGTPVAAVAGLAEEDAHTRAMPWAAFLRRPITIGAVADTMDRLVSSASRRGDPAPRPPA